MTSNEVDPDVADHARKELAATSYHDVQVITGDGSAGHPAGAPFDRVLATVGVDTVPHTWVAQTIPGGRLVVPITTPFQYPGVLVSDVGYDGMGSGQVNGES